MDSFEYAFDSLLSVYNKKISVYGDCLSFRNFAYCCGEDVAEWFRPAISWEQYIWQLVEFLGIKKEVFLISAQKYRLEKDSFQDWMLLGEMKRGYLRESIQSKFYRGVQDFYLCKRSQKEKILILCNPLGSPYIEITEEELLKMLELSSGFVLGLDGIDKIQIPEAAEVLWKGSQWRVRTKNQKERLENFNFEKICIEKTSEKVALKYALMNYRIQTNKLVQYYLSNIKTGYRVRERVNSAMFQILNVGETIPLNTIKEAEYEIWECVSKIGR